MHILQPSLTTGDNRIITLMTNPPYTRVPVKTICNMGQEFFMSYLFLRCCIIPHPPSFIGFSFTPMDTLSLLPSIPHNTDISELQVKEIANTTFQDTSIKLLSKSHLEYELPSIHLPNAYYLFFSHKPNR